jgi:hypothetical protein
VSVDRSTSRQSRISPDTSCPEAIISWEDGPVVERPFHHLRITIAV